MSTIDPADMIEQDAMDPRAAEALLKAVFGTRTGEMARVPLNPGACAAFSVAFPEVPIANHHQAGDRDAMIQVADALRSWAKGLERRAGRDLF